MVNETQIWKWLEEIPDPEIPVLSILDLGIVREVRIKDACAEIVITPTYSGCPAMKHIEDVIVERIGEHIPVSVSLVLSPAWTTDWLTENGRNKLREYGIAPPENEVDKSVLFAAPVVVPCPRCHSKNTRMVSQFGSTACKAQYQCNDCQEPFDYFKCLR